MNFQAFLFNLLLSLASIGQTFAYPAELLNGKFTSWGIDPSYTTSSINLKKSWSAFDKKKDVVVAVIDTGIQFNHPFLMDTLIVKEGNFSEKNYGVDFSGNLRDSQPEDTHNHGTHVAGIIKSVFPDVKILALKYYNPSATEEDHLSATTRALSYAVNQGVDIINYSAGGPGSSRAELEILKEAEKKGILVVTAAGNKSSNIDEEKNAFYPGSYDLSNIITVGAHDEYNKLVTSSNWGIKSVDIAAPGYKIKSSIPGNGTGYMTGTSQATAFVTGVAALIKAKHPDFNFQQLRNVLISSSSKIDTLKGKVFGNGKLDAARAMDMAAHVQLQISGRAVAGKK